MSTFLPVPTAYSLLYSPIQIVKPQPDLKSLLLSKMKSTLLLAGLGAMTAMAGVLQHRQNDLPHCIDGEGIVEGVWQDRAWFLNPFSARKYRF